MIKVINIFIITSPIILFISKIIIEKYNIPSNNIYLVPLRNSSLSLIKANKIYIKLTLLDKLFRKIFLFSLFGIRLRRIIEKECGNFILYCDWDNRDNVEILNSDKCLTHAYIEEGQTAFNDLKMYRLRKNRIYQWFRLMRWKKSSELMSKNSLDNPIFDEYFNDKAFAFLHYLKILSLIKKSKKVFLNEFNYVKKYYKPHLQGTKYIGLMCSPRRLKHDWTKNIEKLLNKLQKKSVIKLHPEFYANQSLFIKFRNIFNSINKKEILICNSEIIIEAEMLFEKSLNRSFDFFRKICGIIRF